MSETPEDVAQAVWADLCIDDRCVARNGCGCRDAIASAIAAERARITESAAAIERLTAEWDECHAAAISSSKLMSEANEKRRAVEARVTLLEGALREIVDYHIPDCPAHFGGDEIEWAQRQHGHLRSLARAALTPSPAPVPPGDAPHDASAEAGSPSDPV